MRLCGPHAALLGVEDRAEELLGTMFMLDKWMEENGSSEADEEYLGCIRHRREEVVAALRLNRMQLRSAREVLGPPLALWRSYRIREATRPSS